MVIRGRRVNRCDTCTRRKVKCDEGRPGCERCKKSGLQCGGYSFNLVIVGPKDGLSSAPGKLVIWRPQLDDSAQSETQPPRRQRPIQPKPQIQSPAQQRIRCLQPSEDAILAGHILSRFSPPSDAEASAPAALLPQLIKMDKSLSAQALSAIYFGKMRNQYQVYQKGTRLYVQALDQLRKAIDNPVTARQNDTLTSVLCLCLYEHVVLSETTAWLKHYQGVGRLVEYRGPQSHQTEFERDIFRICRFMIILAAGVTKSHCFLSEERWKSSRAQPSYQYQAAVDRLYDIMAGVPGLFHDMDYLTHHDKFSESPLYTILRDQAQRILSELYEWPQYLSQCAQLDTSPRFSDPDGAGELDMPLPPKNPAIAAALAIFYATILSLATATDYFELPLNFPSITRAPTRTEQSTEACDPVRKARVRKTLACEICHLATATLRGEQSTSTAFFFIFSLQVAHQHLPPNTPEGMRLEGLLDSVIAEKHGFETGRTREWAALFNSPPALE